MPRTSEKPLRVLHVIPWRARRYGGPAHAIVGMCRQLRERGVDVLIASTDADGARHQRVELERVVDYDGVPSIFFRRQWHDSFQFSRPLAQWVDRRVSDFDALHIHGIFSHPCIVAARACRRARVPYIVRPFGSLDPWSMRQSRIRKRVFWHLTIREMLHRAAAIHYTTDEERRLAETTLALGGGVVIPLGIELQECERADPSLFRSGFGIGANTRYMLTLSRLHPKKGTDLLIRAFADLRARDQATDVMLVVAGDGDPAYVQGLKALAAERGLAKHVLFTGWLTGPLKFSALSGAEAFALFSHQENFAVSVAEALACGTPVMLSRGVNLAPVVEQLNAGWVSSQDPTAIRMTLETALANPAARHEKAQAGRRFAQRAFSWPEIAETLATTYATVAGRP